MDNATQYLDDIVEPAIKDLENNPTSVRHAFLACVATVHTVDYIGRAVGETSPHLRQVLRKESDDFALVDAVAHGFEHVSVCSRAQPWLKAGELARPPANSGMAQWGLSRWGDAEGAVALDKARGVDLLETVQRAALFLRLKVSGFIW